MVDAQTYAVVDSNDEVVNTVLWDGETDFDPGQGMRLVPERQARQLARRQARSERSAEERLDDLLDGLEQAGTMAEVKKAARRARQRDRTTT